MLIQKIINLAADCSSDVSCSNGLKNDQRIETKRIKERKLPPIDAISLVSAHEVRAQEENLENVENEKEWAYKSMGRIAVFAILIIGLSVFSVIPWTSIPRTNSIIYQSYWLELLLPTTSI